MNTAILICDPVKFENQLTALLKVYRNFRFHDTGDFMNKKHFEMCMNAVIKNPHCDINCYTKSYEIVNEWLDTHEKPDNFYLKFSAWDGIVIPNRHNLPITAVEYPGENLNIPNSIKCPSDPKNKKAWTCKDCYLNGCGCYELKPGNTLIIKGHGQRYLNKNKKPICCEKGGK